MTDSTTPQDGAAMSPASTGSHFGDQCRCGLATRLVGDGCQYCNPQMAIDILSEQVAELRLALADAIRSPMGVVPESADGLVTQEELDAAEKRRRVIWEHTGSAARDR